ncbi:hypothetical protein GR702_20200 [Novosphingobium sp. FGD1]|uniref:Uncharacterized protein n=1 Tax=Novosphingobium silvae TaxID=2692619 RepID=A0A7X4GK56_9SPHN|nr:DUF6683 family protein [Novosphingobium silvae]MYM00084.1 hypothetical protein [Novosphingobium silvae]
MISTRRLAHATARSAWLALIAPAAVLAQDIGPALDPGVMVGWAGGEAARYDNERRSGAAADAARRTLDARALAPHLLSATPVGAKSLASLTYRPSAAVRRQNFAHFVRASREVDPTGAASLERFLGTNDVMGLADQWMKPYGMATNNVADAVSVYLTSAWLATRGSAEDPEPALMRGVRDQIAAAVGATPAIAEASDAQKQELAEAMIVQAILVSQYVEAAQGDPALMRQVQDAAATGAKASFDIDLRTLDLSPRGLRAQ